MTVGGMGFIPERLLMMMMMMMMPGVYDTVSYSPGYSLKRQCCFSSASLVGA